MGLRKFGTASDQRLIDDEQDALSKKSTQDWANDDEKSLVEENED